MPSPRPTPAARPPPPRHPRVCSRCCVAQHHRARAAEDGSLQSRQGIFRVGFIVVEEVLGIVDHLLPKPLSRHRVADHAQVLFHARAQHPRTQVLVLPKIVITGVLA